MGLNITTEDFKKKVYNIDNVETIDDLKLLGNNPVVIDFHTKWCGPCKMLSPVIDELSEEYNGKVDFYKVDIEDEMELAQSFGVMSVPTLLFIPKNGKPQLSPGAPPKNRLKEIIDESLLGKEVKKDSMSEFNSIMGKIKGLLNDNK